MLQNLNKAAEPGQESIIYLQSPTVAGESAGAFELLIKIKKDLRENKINYDNCQVLVSLNTIKFGLVVARVKIHGRELQCCFRVEEIKAKDAIDKSINVLIERLQTLGFYTTVAPTEVVPAKKPLVQQLTETGETPLDIGQLDIRI